jgi:hypothetical protein
MVGVRELKAFWLERGEIGSAVAAAKIHLSRGDPQGEVDLR